MAERRLIRYFWQSLPGYFHENDTYKADDPASLNRGILERYLDALQAEDEVLDGYITALPDQLFPLSTEEKFLTFIAGLYGNPPDTFGDVDWYRALLRNIIEINKVKGTIEGLEKFFAIMSTEIGVTRSEVSYYRYDDGNHYDDGITHYDGYCDPCAILNINILAGSPIPGISGATYSESLKRNIQSILSYLLPINTTMGTFSYDGVTRVIKFSTNEPNLIKFP